MLVFKASEDGSQPLTAKKRRTTLLTAHALTVSECWIKTGRQLFILAVLSSLPCIGLTASVNAYLLGFHSHLHSPIQSALDRSSLRLNETFYQKGTDHNASLNLAVQSNSLIGFLKTDLHRSSEMGTTFCIADLHRERDAEESRFWRLWQIQGCIRIWAAGHGPTLKVCARVRLRKPSMTS